MVNQCVGSYLFLIMSSTFLSLQFLGLTQNKKADSLPDNRSSSCLIADCLSAEIYFFFPTALELELKHQLFVGLEPSGL